MARRFNACGLTKRPLDLRQPSVFVAAVALAGGAGACTAETLDVPGNQVVLDLNTNMRWTDVIGEMEATATLQLEFDQEQETSTGRLCEIERGFRSTGQCIPVAVRLHSSHVRISAFELSRFGGALEARFEEFRLEISGNRVAGRTGASLELIYDDIADEATADVRFQGAVDERPPSLGAPEVVSAAEPLLLSFSEPVRCEELAVEFRVGDAPLFLSQEDDCDEGGGKATAARFTADGIWPGGTLTVELAPLVDSAGNVAESFEAVIASPRPASIDNPGFEADRIEDRWVTNCFAATGEGPWPAPTEGQKLAICGPTRSLHGYFSAEAIPQSAEHVALDLGFIRDASVEVADSSGTTPIQISTQSDGAQLETVRIFITETMRDGFWLAIRNDARGDFCGGEARCPEVYVDNLRFE